MLNFYVECFFLSCHLSIRFDLQFQANTLTELLLGPSAKHITREEVNNLMAGNNDVRKVGKQNIYINV